jgi:NADP-dependent 3-hydroxy acid dehydrogenase YdfG
VADTVLVTGSSRGIGRAIALRLAQDHDVIGVARSGAELTALGDRVRATGGKFRGIPLDLRDARANESALGGLDVYAVINNAGIMHMKPILELSPAQWHEMVDVNYSAIYHICRALLPRMVERGSGHVVNIASIAGRSAFVGGAAYASTKHAVLGLSESLMLEVRDRGVRVSVVMPGSVASGPKAPGTDMSWMLKPEDVAQAVAAVLAMPPHALIYQVEVRASHPKKGR